MPHECEDALLHGHGEDGEDDDEGAEDARPDGDVAEPGDLDDVGHGDVHASGHGDHARALVPRQKYLICTYKGRFWTCTSM